MKLHLPKKLFAAVMACMATFSGLSTTIGTGFIAGGAMTIAFVAQEARAADYGGASYTQDFTVGTGEELHLNSNGNQEINGTVTLNGGTLASKQGNGDNRQKTIQVLTGSGSVIDNNWNTIWNIQALTGTNCDITWNPNGTHWTASIMNINGGEYSGSFTVKKSNASSRGPYQAILQLNEGAGSTFANAALKLEGTNAANNVAALAINTGNATVKSLSGNSFSYIYAGVAPTEQYAVANKPAGSGSATLTVTSANGTFSGEIGKNVTLNITGGTQVISGATLGSTIQVGTGATLTLSGDIILSYSMPVMATANGFDVSVAVASGAGMVNTTGVTSWFVEGAQRTGSFENGLFKYTGTVYGVRVADEVVSAENVANATGYVVEEGLTATVQDATSAGLASVVLKNDSTLKLSSDAAVEYTGGSFNVSGVAKLELTGDGITWHKQITCADANSALQLTVTEGSNVLWTIQAPQNSTHSVTDVTIGKNATMTVAIDGINAQYPVFVGNINTDSTITLQEGATLNSGNLSGWYQANAGSRLIALEKDATWNITGGTYYVNKTTISLSGAEIVLGDGVVMQFERPNDNNVNVISTTATAEQMSLITAAAGSATAGTLKFQNTDGVFDINRGDFTLAETNTADLKVDVAILNGDNGQRKLIKNGDGVLELTRANAYTGETNINGGTIKLSGAGTFGSNAVNMAAGTTLELASTESLTHANTFKGSAYNVVHSGTGTSTLTGLNVWDCSEVDVQAGTLKLTGNMVLGAWMEKAKIATGTALDVSGITRVDYDGFTDWTLISESLQEDGSMLCSYELGYAEGVTGITALTALDTALTADTTNRKLIYENTISKDTIAMWDKNWGSELIYAPSNLTPQAVTSTTGLYDASNTTGYVAIEATTGGDDVIIFGGDSKPTMSDDEVWIKASSGKFLALIGGSQCLWQRGNSSQLNDTHILVSGEDTTVGHIIGGFLQECQNPVMDGSTYISVMGGSITGNIAGSAAMVDGDTYNSKHEGDTNIFIYVPLNNTTTAPNLKGSADPKNVIAGSSIALYNGEQTHRIVRHQLNGSTNITIDLGEYQFDGEKTNFVKSIYGGSYTVRAGRDANDCQVSLEGDTNIRITSSDKVTYTGDIVGGSLIYGGTSTVSGMSKLLIEGVETDGVTNYSAFSGMVVGGSYHYLPNGKDKLPTTQVGGVNVQIEGGSFNNVVIGGTYLANGGTATIGDIDVSFGGTINQNLIGASYVAQNTSELTSGNVTLSLIEGADTGWNVAGGYFIADTGSTSLNATVKDIAVSLEGGTSKDMFGGSIVNRNNADATINQGNITINLTKGTAAGHVYAAGWQRGTSVMQTASTTVNLHSDVLIDHHSGTSTQTIISGGYKFDSGRTGSMVTGTRTLNLTGTERDVSGLKVQDFDVVNVGVEKLAVYTATEFSNLGVVNIGAGTDLSFWDGQEESTNGVLTLGGAATLSLLKTPAAEGVMLLAGGQTTPMLGDLAVQLPADWDSTDETEAITLIGGLAGVTLRDAAMTNRVKASEVFSTLNGAAFDTYKDTYYLLMDTEDGALKLVNGSYGASDFYWRGGATDTWTSEKWDYDAEDGKDDYIYIQNVPHKTAVNAIFDEESTQTITIDTDAVVDTLTVTNGSYTFAQDTVDDGNGGTTPVGSLTIEDKLTIGDAKNPTQAASAILDMAVKVTEIELASGAASLTVNEAFVPTKDDDGKDVPISLIANKGGAVINGIANGDNLVFENAIIGGTAQKLGTGTPDDTSDDGIEINHLTLSSAVLTDDAGIPTGHGGGITFVNATITGAIDNGSDTNLSAAALQFVGTTVLDRTAMGDLISDEKVYYYNYIDGLDVARQDNVANGYVSYDVTAQIFTNPFGVTSLDPEESPDSGNTWVYEDGSHAKLNVDKITGEIIFTGDAGTHYMAADSTVAVVYDATNSEFAKATDLVLNGGSIVLNTGLDKSEGSKLTGGIRAEKDGTITISENVTLAQADLNANGKQVTLLGVGTYDLGEGIELSTGVGLGTDDPATTDTAEPIWAGTVTTSATAISDISGLGTADSAVALTSDIVTESLTTGAVGKVTMKSLVADSLESAKSDVSIAGATTLKKDSTVGTAAFNGGLTLGTEDGAAILTGEELTLSTLNMANLNSAVEAARLSNDSLNINIDKKLLGELIQGDYRSLVTLWDDDSLASLSFNGESDCVLEEKGAKYHYSIGWEETESVAPLATDDTTAGTNGEGTLDGTVDNVLPPANVVVLTTVQNPNYMKEKYSDMEENALAGADLLDDAFVKYDPQNQEKKGDIAAIIDAVDGNKVSQEDLAAVAGSSIATLGMALSGDVERQLSAIRNRTTSMGVNECVVNEGMPYFNAWVNAEGNRAELEKDSTLAGYTMDSWGGTVGFDVDLNPNLTMGMAITAMYGSLTADGPETKAEGDMDTYYVSLFARYASCAWTHTFVATVGMMDGSFNRTVSAGKGYETEGTTDGMSFGLMYEVGYVMPLDEDATACLQPVFNVMLRHSTVGSYTEEGGDAALDVGSQSMTTLTFGLGARLQAVVGESVYNRASIFEARVLGKVDVGDRQSEADVAFAGGSGHRSTVKSAELGAFGVELGAGLTIPMGDDDGSIFVDGSVELRSGYTNVNGTVGYRINF